MNGNQPIMIKYEQCYRDNIIEKYSLLKVFIDALAKNVLKNQQLKKATTKTEKEDS